MLSKKVRQGSLFVIFAHPDDEFAVFPWLRQALLGGRNVQAIWLTDGGWGGQSTERRRSESITTLMKLGMNSSAMHFCGMDWAIPDGELYTRLKIVVPLVLQRFGAPNAGGEILMPAWEGGHHDHDASHLVGIQLGQVLGARMSQYSLYHGEGLTGSWFKVLSPLTTNGAVDVLPTRLSERLHCALLCLNYRSQWKSFLGLLPLYLLRMFQANAFGLQSIDPERTAQRPHEGPMLYERRGGVQWADFAAATGTFRSLTARHQEVPGRPTAGQPEPPPHL